MASKTLLEDLKSEQSIPLFRSASHLYSAAPPESVSTSKYTVEPGFNELQIKKKKINKRFWLERLFEKISNLSKVFHSSDQHRICTQQLHQKACLRLSTLLNLVLMNFKLRKNKKIDKT